MEATIDVRVRHEAGSSGCDRGGDERLRGIMGEWMRQTMRIISFCDTNAKTSGDRGARIFLRYLHAVGSEQLNAVRAMGGRIGIPEMIVERSGGGSEKREAALSVKGGFGTLTDYYDYAYRLAVEEADAFLPLEKKEPLPLVRSILGTLVDLSIDFLFEVKSAYFKIKNSSESFEGCGAGTTPATMESGEGAKNHA